jgi:hypothetical protein
VFMGVSRVCGNTDYCANIGVYGIMSGCVQMLLLL